MGDPRPDTMRSHDMARYELHIDIDDHGLDEADVERAVNTALEHLAEDLDAEYAATISYRWDDGSLEVCEWTGWNDSTDVWWARHGE